MQWFFTNENPKIRSFMFPSLATTTKWFPISRVVAKASQSISN
jgi:hypothetical protein